MNDNSIQILDLSKPKLKMLNNQIKSKKSNFNNSIKSNKEKLTKKKTQPPKSSKKIRNIGVDFIRMIAMNGIIINHLVYQGKGVQKFSKYEKQIVLLNSLFFWHNNGFILISGFVGYKTNKYANLLYLWLCSILYSVGICIYFTKIRPHSSKKYNISREYFPIIYERYWYFTIYFGMYLFLPVINKGISLLTKAEFKLLIASFIGIFSFWENYKGNRRDPFKINRGYSIVWFFCLYLTGAYMGKYRPNYKGIKKFIFCIICLLIYGFATFLYYKMINNELNFGEGFLGSKIKVILNQIFNLNLNSVLKVAQSIPICLFALQINFNKYIGRIISFCGPLNFGVYLIHINTIFSRNILANIFNKYTNNYSLSSAILLILLNDLKIYFFCICVDYFRYIIFEILRIRKICNFLEKMIFKFMS